MKHTPGPWKAEPLDEHGGYDCMYAGICVGPVTLDGCDYGQKSCEPLDPAAFKRMQADARLIAAAPELLQALKAMRSLAIKYITRDHKAPMIEYVGIDRALELINRIEGDEP